MATVKPFRRQRWRAPRRPPPANFLRPRRPWFAWLGRHFGFLALIALVIGATAFAHRPWHELGAPRPVVAASIRVIDGDTLRAAGERIRLSGIDAPELSQTCRDAHGREWQCGRAAKARLVDLVSRGSVACSARGRDRYGRTLAICSAGDIADLGEALVRDGYAVDYRRYTSDYLAAEDEARAARRGIWQGDFERPEDWRRRHPRS